MVKRTHVESPLLVPWGYDPRYCLLTCLLLLRDRKGLRPTPPPLATHGTETPPQRPQGLRVGVSPQ